MNFFWRRKLSLYSFHQTVQDRCLLFTLQGVVAFICATLILPPQYLRAAEVPSPAPVPQPDEQEEAKTRQLKALDDILAGEKHSRHPLDTFRILEQKVFPAKGTIRSDNLTIRVVGKNGENLGETFRFDAKKFTHRGQNAGLLTLTEGTPFQILRRGERLHQFNMYPRQVGFYGNYLLFSGEADEVGSTKNIYLIDLEEFEPSLGKTELPIFRVPIRSRKPIVLSIRNGDLLVSGDEQLRINPSILKEFSNLQQIGYNITVGLVSPETYQETHSLVSEIDQVFMKGAKLAAETKSGMPSAIANARRDVIDFSKVAVRQQASLDPGVSFPFPLESQHQKYFEIMGASNGMNTAINSFRENREVQRSLLARLGLLWSHLSLPPPKNGPMKIKKALGMAVGSLFGGQGQLREATLQLIHNRYIKRGAPVAAAVTLGALFPNTLSEFARNGLELTHFVFSNVWGYSRSLGELFKETVSSTLSGFNPYTLHQTYIADGNLKRTTVGMTAAFCTLFMVLGTPHIVVNSVALGKDLKAKQEQNGWRGAFEFARNFKRRFISRQQDREEQYLKDLSEAESEEEAAQFSPEDDAFVEHRVDELDEQYKDWFDRFLGSIKKFSLFKRTGDGSKAKRKLSTLSGALMHFLFSACSFTISGKVYAHTWNAWFMFRSLVLRPVLFGTALYFPNYFHATTQRRESATLPTEYNGGLRPLHHELGLRVTKLFGGQALNTLKAFEKKIKPVEAAIEKAALRKAFHSLLEFIEDPKGFKRLIETQGIDSITDKTLYALPTEARNYFSMFFMRANERAMRRFLEKAAGRSGEMTVAQIQRLSVSQLKQATANALQHIDLSEGEAKDLVNAVCKEDQLAQEVERDLHAAGTYWERVRNKFHLKNTKALDPARNSQIDRFNTVRRQVAKPQAMARAVRSTMAALVVDKPLELGFLFLCLAGVETGINQVLYEDMFGPNSWFYLGRFSVLNGFVMALILDLLSTVWWKLQQDNFNEEEFDEIPEPKGQYAKGGFFKWQAKQFFNARNAEGKKVNTLWKNQKEMLSLIWSNIPAALVTYLVFDLISLGRWDLDTYLTGYLLYFTVPFEGFDQKLEQSFEFASNYFKKDIPKKYHSHPVAQRYFMRRLGRQRVWFNMFYKTYENIFGHFINNLETISTDQLGPRALSRWVFGGATPTEWVVDGLSKIAASPVGAIPGVQTLVNGCIQLISNNYTDWKPGRP